MILYRIALIELEMTENNQNTLSLFEYKGKTPPEYTVTEVSNIIKRSIEDNFDFVRIRGEISGLKIAPSGHVYFSLKDKGAVLSAVCWKGVASSLKHRPEEGLEVVCTGSVTTYPGQSKYQMIIKSISPAGIGALMALLEKRKQDFEKEGIFDKSHKKTIPFLPQRIAVVTSPTGAVIQDILHRIEDRYPCHVLVWPVLVQGEQSAQQIAKAIYGLNNLEDPDLKPDVIIVARGGGSLEDLWSFNEEIVVRATFNSKIPIISAVGHETDTTLIDYVSDIRAPTPTAAAEFAVPVKNDLAYTLRELDNRYTNSLKNHCNNLYNEVKVSGQNLPNLEYLTSNYTQKIDDFGFRLSDAFPRYHENMHHQLKSYAAELKSPQQHLKIKDQNLNLAFGELRNLVRESFKDKIYHLKYTAKNLSLDISDKETSLQHVNQLLDSYHYKNTLKRGFAIVRDQDNKIVKSTKHINSNKISIEVADGKKEVQIVKD
jgi:exodeoxyribonuclease VII large subunit